MVVYKFGGASIKDAEAVKNLSRILKMDPPQELLIVLSAMGKTTNALEDLLQSRIKHKNYGKKLDELIGYHNDIVGNLFPDKKSSIYSELADQFESLRQILGHNKKLPPDHFYDQVIPYGELISSMIVSSYLKHDKIPCEFIDARKFIRTDSTFREGKVDWEFSEKKTNSIIPDILKKKIVLTQGFIGSDNQGNTTTLGREGSDFTAAIFAHCLDAESVTIWKDVDGILNADPKLLEDTQRFPKLSYREAAEMTYYGASVIHPKTIKPLAVKKIPLQVKSFIHPKNSGTEITHRTHAKLKPSIIFKFGQTLISFRVKDYSFINEENLRSIFHELALLNIKINLMQNSAIRFSICVDHQACKITSLIKNLRGQFKINYNRNLQLITVKNYDQHTAVKFSQNKKILLEQRTRSNFQIVVRS